MFWSDYSSNYGENEVVGSVNPGDSSSRPAHSDVLVRDAREFATTAIKCDQAGQYQTAIFYYAEAIQAMYNASLADPNLNLAERYSEYTKRVKELHQIVNQNSGQAATQTKSAEQMAAERAKFLLRQAFDEDGHGNAEDATELYLNAAEMCIEAARSCSSGEQRSKLNILAKQAMDRAEQLKTKNEPVLRLPEPPSSLPDLPNNASIHTSHSSHSTPQSSPKPTKRNTHSAGSASVGSNDGRLSASGGGGGGGPNRGGNRGGGGGSYTAEEIKVLRTTSFINGREFLPYISQADLKEKFAFSIPFTDKLGQLALAAKQKSRLAKFVRPSEFCSDPQMIFAVSAFSIKQTIVQDCSFLASLAISANYERRFKKSVITKIVYPQDKQGKPIYNPCGKYMVILHLNGVKRKVIIDDYLPMDKHGDLLCSFSNNRNELWVSLLEKAYMKVMGGYDFPGSNSNIDLHALTGWIPERQAIRPDSKEFDKDKVFAKLKDRFHKGDVLATLATGMMSDAEGDRAGLVPTHAYAMLDIREIMGRKLLQLKNPWSHLRWKGRYSETDETNWTAELQKALNFDPKNAQQFDNGVFWIDLDSLCHFFDVIYMNWNPKLFPYTYVIHSEWKAGEGPKKDNFNLSNNPQYKLDVRGNGAVWVLLTRHITDKDDFADNKEFITLLVYKGGKKVYYPNDPPPYIDGTRINSPHYLCKMLIQDKSVYTIVVSQFEKSNTIRYSLRVYSTCEFKLSKMPEPYTNTKQITGEWKGRTAGGCANNRASFVNNPIYQVTLLDKTKGNYFMVDLKGPREFHVGFEIVAIASDGPGTASFNKQMSGDYRRGFTVVQLEDLPGGTYNIRPTTFAPGQEGPFFLTLSASCPMKVAQLQ
ncbi:calpain-7-like [Patiria miniata]|uniref:Calpain catalytic domain-containing protein n=1 Tax=Patiria miniata TaxID=46514 RepID=A0A913YY49_PATMI|nr:calpain-7-like [Patiria miniata]